MSSHHYQSVLPDNSSPLMRAIEKAFRAQLEAVNDPFPQLLNPKLTPKQFLSALALEVGVNDWFETDTESDQRAIVGDGLIVQKEAGTRSGLKRAAESIALDATVTPWFKKEDGKPYEIYVEAIASTEKPIDAQAFVRLDARISHHKSERDIIDFNISRTSLGAPCIGVMAEVGVTMTSFPYYPTSSESVAAKSVGAFSHLRIISTSEPAI
ncbi:phage tail protein I [Vibrio parahaemolyticus]|uniref:phage tail protein I n=1 Tax=Vibrio parahaemolyticus TaxID=670 RepID=UPI00111E2631|nr:phage tail protein I [Vibrio parahaemolyticus]TOK10847.1 phage tail protein I [Vibrio parahaemolyticus]